MILGNSAPAGSARRSFVAPARLLPTPQLRHSFVAPPLPSSEVPGDLQLVGSRIALLINQLENPRPNTPAG